MDERDGSLKFQKHVPACVVIVRDARPPLQFAPDQIGRAHV